MLLPNGECTKGADSMSSLRSAFVAAARRLIAGLACAALLLVSGCVGPVLIRLQVAGFDEAAVEGVGVWREPGQPGQWELVAELPLTPNDSDGTERLLYGFELPDGSVVSLATALERDIEDPDRVTMSLWYYPDDAGVLRVSVYNAAGHSALSQQELEIPL
jgi:hypothetical protein